MKIDVKSALVDILKKESIRHVFGHTGSHVFKLCRAIEESDIDFILGRQEGNAVYMANGYAQISKRPSVVVATLGPGVTNMVTGAATAYMDSIPMILIGGTVTGEESGRNAMQECSGRGRSPEQRLLFKEVCKQSIVAPSPEFTPHAMREAFRVANSGRKGPVYIEIPGDYWDQEIEYQSLSTSSYQDNSLAHCDSQSIQVIAEALYQAKHPVIILGEGADEENIKVVFSQFIRSIKVPFTVTPLAKSFVDEFDPLYLGAIRGGGRTQKAYEYIHRSDFILFLGARMHEPEMNWDDKTLVEGKVLAQVDFDATEIGRVYPINMSSIGSVSSFIKGFGEKKHSRYKVLLNDLNQLLKDYPRLEDYEETEKGVNPLNICNIVERLVGDDAVFVTDTGWVKQTGIIKVRTKLNQSFVVSDKNGSMGFGIPAAMGANLASKREAICLVGDGGAQMSINELGILLNTDIKVIIIVFNNGGCACMFGTGQKTTAFINPDFVKLAHAYNMVGFKTKTKTEFEQSFLQAQTESASSIIEVMVDQDSMIWE